MIHRRARFGLIAALLVISACQEEPVASSAGEMAASTAEPAAGATASFAPRNPVARALQLSAELGLTPDQVARLTAIGQRLQAANEPLLAQVRSILGESRPGGNRAARELSDEERAARRARMEQARPVLEKIRENRRAAAEAARAVLTHEQRTALRSRAPAHSPQDRTERPGRRVQGENAGSGDPIGRILARGTEISLSQEQIAGLASIQGRLKAQNRPLHEQLKGVLGERRAPGELGEEERAARRAKMEQARPILEKLRQNTRAAMEEARALLTEAQRSLLSERAGTPRGPRGRRGG